MADIKKSTIVSWRDFSIDPAFKEGLVFLLQNHAPKVKRGDSAQDMLHAGIAFGAYSMALDDIEKILTTLAPLEQENPSIPELQR